MALTDINFSEGEGQDFTVEVPLGLLNAPLDIVVESESTGYPVLETPLITSGGDGDIFIIND